jgi:hypothetical protein
MNGDEAEPQIPAWVSKLGIVDRASGIEKARSSAPTTRTCEVAWARMLPAAIYEDAVSPLLSANFHHDMMRADPMPATATTPRHSMDMSSQSRIMVSLLRTRRPGVLTARQ